MPKSHLNPNVCIAVLYNIELLEDVSFGRRASHVLTLIKFLSTSLPHVSFQNCREGFSTYRCQIKKSRWSICHSLHFSHPSQDRRREGSLEMLCMAKKAVVMVIADMQIAFSLRGESMVGQVH